MMERTGVERGSGCIVVCMREFEARSLVRGNKGAPRLQAVEGTE
jgi:hypothetical protein